MKVAATPHSTANACSVATAVSACGTKAASAGGPATPASAFTSGGPCNGEARAPAFELLAASAWPVCEFVRRDSLLRREAALGSGDCGVEHVRDNIPRGAAEPWLVGSLRVELSEQGCG